jgi:hypothetical protein
MTVHSKIETKALDHAPLEDKSAGHAPHDPAVSGAMAELARAFEAFKETNDARIAAIEGRAPGDVLTEEKLARIDAALDTARTRLDRLTLDGRRPPLGASAPAPREGAAAEHKAAFDLYVRAGESGGLKHLEEKALSAGSGPDGGYLVPAEVERTVLTRLANLSPRWSSTPCRPRPKRCSTTRSSTSIPGSPTRSRPPSPSRRAPPSSPATGSAARAAS